MVPVATTAAPPDLGLRVLEGLAAGVVAVDAKGTVLYANAAAARVLRRKANDIVGRRLESVLAPLSELLSRGAGGLPRGEITVTIERTTVALGYSLTTSDDTHIVLFQDISTVQELRRQRDQLLQLAALGDALPTVLHELRNPLAAVTTALEVIIEDIEGADDPLRADLHAVLSELRRMNLSLQGVGGLLRSVHAHDNNAIDHAVAEACRVLEPTAARKGVSLRHVSNEDLPLLPLDRGVLSGVIFNLVKNALDACKKDDSIEVQLRLEGGRLRLTVSDTGHGMTEEVRKRCTELFFTKKDKGSGIGLALCKEVADAAGGSLHIESTVGEGTSVTLSIPVGPLEAVTSASKTRR